MVYMFWGTVRHGMPRYFATFINFTAIQIVHSRSYGIKSADDIKSITEMDNNNENETGTPVVERQEITEFYNMTIALGSYGNDDFQAEVFGNIPEEKLQEAHSAFAENQRNLRVETKDGLRFFIAFYPSYNWIYGGGTMSYFKIDNQMRNWIERNVGWKEKVIRTHETAAFLTLPPFHGFL